MNKRAVARAFYLLLGLVALYFTIRILVSFAESAAEGGLNPRAAGTIWGVVTAVVFAVLVFGILTVPAASRSRIVRAQFPGAIVLRQVSQAPDTLENLKFLGAAPSKVSRFSYLTVAVIERGMVFLVGFGSQVLEIRAAQIQSIASEERVLNYAAGRAQPVIVVVVQGHRGATELVFSVHEPKLLGATTLSPADHQSLVGEISQRLRID